MHFKFVSKMYIFQRFGIITFPHQMIMSFKLLVNHYKINSKEDMYVGRYTDS